MAGMMRSLSPTQLNEKCHECGEPAAVLYVADEPERETGYVECLTLCDDCETLREQYQTYCEMRAYGWGV